MAAIFAVVMLPGLPRPTRGAVITWTGLGATTNWNLGANWSTGVAPGAADTAVFDGTGSKAVVVNANISVAGVQVAAAYGGSITQGAGRTITVGTTGWSQAGSTFTGSAAAITVNGPYSLTGGTFTSTTGILSVGGNVTVGAGSFAHNGGTLRLIGATSSVDVPGSLTLRDLALAQGNAVAKTLDLADTLVVTGTLTLTNGTWEGGELHARGPIAATSGFDGGSGTLRIDGSTDQLMTGAATISAGELPNVVIDKPSGTLTLAGTLRVATGGWSYVGGGLDAGTSTVTFDSGSVIAGSHTLANVVLRGSGAKTLPAGDTLGVSGLLTLTDGTWDGGTLLAAGDLAAASAFDGGSGTLRIAGGGAQLLTGSATSTTGQLPAVVIDKPSGTLTLAGTLRTLHDWTYVAGGVDAGGSTLVLGGALTLTTDGAPLNRLQVRGGSSALGGDLILAGDLIVTSGTFDLAAQTVDVAGSVTVAGTLVAADADLHVARDLLVTGTLIADGSRVTLDGAVLQHLDTDGAALGDLVVMGAVGAVLDEDLEVDGALDLAAGSLTLGAHRLTIAAPIVGTPTSLVADATSSLTIDGVAQGIHVPASVTDLASLAIETAESVILDGPLAIGAALVLDGGPLDAGPHRVRILPGASVSRTSGHVIGTLEKAIAAGGPTTVTFEIGDGAGYTPLVATWDVVSIGGTLAASTVAGDDDAALTAVGLVPAASVNRTWTLEPVGMAAEPVELDVTYLVADLDPKAAPTALLAAATDAGTTTLATVVSRSASGLIVALPSVPAGALALGMPGSDLGVVLGGAADVLVGAPYTAVVTATNLGAFGGIATVELALDSRTAVVSITPSQGACSVLAGAVSCDLGSIASGGIATIDVVVSFSAAGSHVLTAGVIAGAATIDANAANDAATLTVVATTPAGPQPEPEPSPTEASPRPSQGAGPGQLPDTAGGGISVAGVVNLTVAALAGLLLIALARLVHRRPRRWL